MFGIFIYFMIEENSIWVTTLAGAIFCAFLGMTLPIYFNLGGELIYPIGEAYGTTLFTAGMNIFGLLVIEIVKVIESKVGSESPDKNVGLVWTAAFQGGLFFLGLIFFLGRVNDFDVLLRKYGGYRNIKHFACDRDFAL